MRSLLGIDIGTLGTKVVLVREDGQVQAAVSEEHAVHHPREGWAEHDPVVEWWGSAVSLVRRALAESHVRPSEISAVGVGGAFPSPCLADARGVPLRRAILYSDNRAEGIIRELNDEYGLGLTGDDVTPRLVWLARHEPEIIRDTRMVFNVHTYVGYRLTGAYALDFATATWFGGLYLYPSASWDSEFASRIGLQSDFLPPVVPADQVIGGVTAQASRETGLVEGTPVIAGTGDMYLALYGTGALDPGEAIVYYGTAGLLLLGIRPIAEVFGRPCLPARGELAVLAAYIQASGEAVTWFSEFMGRKRMDRDGGGSHYRELDREAAKIEPGSGGVLVLPHFLGERSPSYRPNARGCIYGLTPHHTPAHVFRAILESFGFGIGHALRSLPQGVPKIERLFATGGGAASPLWRQIVSDILQREQIFIPKASGALGAAYLAGVATDIFPDYSGIRDLWLSDRQVTSPMSRQSPAYEAAFSDYVRLYQSLAGFSSVRGGRPSESNDLKEAAGTGKEV